MMQEDETALIGAVFSKGMLEVSVTADDEDVVLDISQIIRLERGEDPPRGMRYRHVITVRMSAAQSAGLASLLRVAITETEEAAKYKRFNRAMEGVGG